MRDEELRARLRDLHDAAASVVAPPGVDHARRAVRRRRIVRTTLASTTIAALCVLAIVLSTTTFRPPKPSISPSPSASSPSPSATPDPQRSPPTPLPSTPVTPSASGGARASNVGLEPYFLEYGDSLSTTVGKEGSTDIPIGVVTWGSGTVTGVKMTVDLSQITSRIDIVSVGAPCSPSGSTVVCDFGTLKLNGQKRFGTTLSLRAKPGATLGKAGTVHLRLTADSRPGATTASVTVNVESSVADLVITSTVPNARVGQTVTVTYTVKNQGPSPEPWVTVSAGGVQPGTQYVGGNRCTFTATTFECRIDNLAVGQTRVLSVAVRVNGCAPSGDTTGPGVGPTLALADPNYWNNDVQMSIRVQGC